MHMWFGKTSEKQLSEIELSAKLAGMLGDIDSVEITTEAQKQIFSDLAGVDGLLDYLRDIMLNDVKRYFAAENDHDRAIIRGGYSRTAYIRSKILDIAQKE